MRNLILLAFFFVVTVQSSRGQITITESVFTDLYGTEQTITSFTLVNSAALQAIVDASGPNQTWDFSALPVMDSLTVTQQFIELPATLPGSGVSAFADADVAINVVTDTGSVYLYQGIDGGNHINYGSTIVGDIDGDGMDDEFTTVNAPPSVINEFPIQFQNTWSDSTSTTLGGVFASNIIITETEVDGWGTLITPVGSRPALRINHLRRTYNPAFPQLQIVNTQLTFVTNTGVSATILLDEGGSPVTAEYSRLGGDTGTDVERIDTAVPRSFSLTQNYPNPFNPSTHISFSLPEPSDVKLSVYSITGREIATLAEGLHGAGTYEVSFDASNLASGLYLYKLQTKGFVQTRLMSLVK